MCGTTQPANNKKNQKILIISFIIITSFMIIEVIGGLYTKSLALLSDAGHMFSDSLSMLIAIIAFSYGLKKATENNTFGFKRFEILAALFNGLSLIFISVFIVIEALERFQNPTEIASIGMLMISSLGLFVNIVIMLLMIKKADVENNINMKGAYLHVVGDTLGSIGAIIASLCILFFDLTIADPIMSILIALIITKSGIGIIKDSLHILMEGKDRHINTEEVKESILKYSLVNDLYDLHIWTITSNVHALTVKIQVSESSNLNDYQKLLDDIEHDLEDLGISHTTIQFDFNQNKQSLYCDLKIIENHNHHHH